MKRYRALAVTAPAGANLLAGETRLELQRWPDELPMRDLLIVETTAGLDSLATDATGRTVALVDVVEARDWLEEEGAAACAVCREAGWRVWHLANVRPVEHGQPVPARRHIYEIELPADLD